MKNCKCQDLSNPLSSGLESKDSTSWDENSAWELVFAQLSSDPSEVGWAYVEQPLMGLLIDVDLFVFLSHRDDGGRV
jgi:hypothetical protein